MDNVENKKTIFVVFGITGDLARRKLIPAFKRIYDGKKINNFEVLGVGRKDFSKDDFKNYVVESLNEFGGGVCESEFLNRVLYYKINFDDINSYKKLKDYLENIKLGNRDNLEVVFYLAIPPSLFFKVLDNMKSSSLNLSNKYESKIVFEKPFGVDLESARKLNDEVSKVFSEDKIYRIDHYLGKEAVQNFLVLRFANHFLEPLWNNRHIDNIQITASEKIGVGSRAAYYDESGALRDMVQNHLFQMLSLIAMEAPVDLDAEDIRDEKVKVFKAIKDFKGDWDNNVVFGQYEGYLDEDGVKENSRTETYVAMKVEIDNWRWAGVPFYLRTGKKLKDKGTTVVVEFKKLPCILYNKEGKLESNKMIIKIQPDEKIEMQFNIKAPSDKFEINPVLTEFDHKEFFGSNSPEAYEKLLIDIYNGDKTHFTRWDGVEESWKIVDKLVRCHDNCPMVFRYKPGSWGPKEADELLEKDGRKWYDFQ